MTDIRNIDDFLDSLDLDSLTQSDALTYALVQEVRATRAAVASEGRGRRLSVRLTQAAGVVIVLVLVASVVLWRIDDARYSRSTCADRIERSEQIRAAQVAGVKAGVDVVARYAEVPAAERAALSAEASTAAGKAVAAELGVVPGCQNVRPAVAMAATTTVPAAVPAVPVPGIYQSCAAAREAGAAPLTDTDPGWNPALDRDGDGVGCEGG